MTCHVVVGAETASSGELRLRIEAPIGVRGWSLVFGPMAGYLKSVHAVAEEEMKKGWTAKRPWRWASAGFRKRLRQGAEAF